MLAYDVQWRILPALRTFIVLLRVLEDVRELVLVDLLPQSVTDRQKNSGILRVSFEPAGF